MDGCEPATVARYADAGFEHVVLWADQVWPTDRSLDAKRACLLAGGGAARARPAGGGHTSGYSRDRIVNGEQNGRDDVDSYRRAARVWLAERGSAVAHGAVGDNAG